MKVTKEYLRESCKETNLMNDEELDEDMAEFERYLFRVNIAKGIFFIAVGSALTFIGIYWNSIIVPWIINLLKGTGI